MVAFMWEWNNEKSNLFVYQLFTPYFFINEGLMKMEMKNGAWDTPLVLGC